MFGNKTLTIGLLAAGLLAACTGKEIVEYEIPVKSVSVQPTQMVLALGSKETIVATVLPEDATNKNVDWTSNAPEIASVDDRGRVAGLIVGQAVITATTEDGRKTATCTVTVRESVPFYVSVSDFPDFSGEVDVPFDKVFDNVRAEITGFDWQVIETIQATIEDGRVILDLPDSFSAEQLCKVARDTYSDYEGFWPAEQVSDRNAKVAGLGDFIAYRGDERVGRIFLSDWDGDHANKLGVTYIYFHFADRPFTLAGNNLRRANQQTSFHYSASFAEGWNAYANIDGGTNPTICITDLSGVSSLHWRFE